MPATCGRLEAAVVIPTGGWAVAANDGVAYGATVPAGTYSGPTAVLAALVSALNTAAGGAGSARTWTGAIASGEQGTGKATLTISAGANATLNWTQTAQRDLYGFTGNLSGAITWTSTSGCLGLFLADCTMSVPFSLSDFGDYEADISQTRSQLGVLKTIKTVSRLRHPGITWTHVSLARARQSAEASGVRSWERFVRDCILGVTGLSYFNPGSKVTLWPNAGTAGTSRQYHGIAGSSVSELMQPADGSGFVGLWQCRWPGGYGV
jgi:hypothetical protein